MGVATNHMFIGNMVDFDLSIIKFLELTFVMTTTPKVTKATKFHRKLLKVQQLSVLNNSP
jgi:hypothetical protein